MKLRGKLRFEFAIFLEKKQESLKGSRDNKIQKKRETCKLIVSVAQVTAKIGQALIIAFGAAIVVDYLRNCSTGGSWMIVGMVMIALVILEGSRPASS